MKRVLLGALIVLGIAASAWGFPPLVVEDASDDSVTLGGLDCDTRYELRVREWRANNRGTFAWRDATVVEQRTDPCVPPPPPDADGDGTPDATDQCPNEAGPASNNGCPVPPPPPPTCTTANVPGGSDPWGGCFPGPANTGPTGTLTAYSGPCTITTANTVIDSKTINCDIQANASGLVIRNSVLNGRISGSGYSVIDSLIDGHDPYACVNCGADGQNFTILRTEITGTNRGAYCMNVCNIKDSWVHGTDLEPVASNLAHASGFRVEQNATLTHNSISCDFTGPFVNNEIGCSADITGYPDFVPIHHNTITNNLLLSNNVGIGYCAYGGGTNGKPYSGAATNATYVVFRDNIFQRGANGKCGAYGPITDFITGRTGNVWDNNRWDSGELVPAG